MKFLMRNRGVNMNEKKDFQENIIPVLNQNPGSFFPGKKRGGIRVLFVGNSITKHAPKPEVGWNRDCGMCASSLEKDYVHLMQAEILKSHPKAEFAILQVAGYEWEFFKMSPADRYELARQFAADIIIMFFGANVDKQYDTMENPPKTFRRAVEDLRNYLNPDNKAVVAISQGFYIRPVLDAEKKAVADQYGDIFINLEDIRNREDAHGGFNHPGDLGMQLIADRFMEAIRPALKKAAETT